MRAAFTIFCLLAASAFASPIVKKVSLDAGAVSTILGQLAAADTRTDNLVTLSYQNQASHAHFDHDNAPDPLFTSVDKSIFDGATYKALAQLLTFYQPDSSQAEVRSADWESAISNFLDSLLATNVMQSAQKFLVQNGLSNADSFKQQLYQLWFTITPSTKGVMSNTAFKALFYGEVTGNQVTSFNNWIQFYKQEAAGLLDYHGWFSKENGIVIDTQFSWGTFEAVEQSFLLNTSPEFEVAAYSICFVAGQGSCTVQIGSGTVHLKTIGSSDYVMDQCIPSSQSSTPSTATTTKKPTATDSQLQDCVNKMRADDVDKPPTNEYTLNWQNKASGNKDNSPSKLYSKLDESILNRSVYQVLLEVYDQKLFTADVCTAEAAMSGTRKATFSKVLDTWTSTKVFGHAFDYLKAKGVKQATDMTTLKNFLFNLWFGTYSRCKSTTTLGSSGFEHVFSGEWKDGTVDGQHNWQRYYLLEKAGNINYYGYYKYDAQLIGTFEYTWEKELKQEGGFFFGTSPAFDFSLFTICALTHSGSNGCRFTIDGYSLGVTSYTQSCSSGTCLSTSYPTN